MFYKEIEDKFKILTVHIDLKKIKSINTTILFLFHSNMEKIVLLNVGIHSHPKKTGYGF